MIGRVQWSTSMRYRAATDPYALAVVLRPLSRLDFCATKSFRELRVVLRTPSILGRGGYVWFFVRRT